MLSTPRLDGSLAILTAAWRRRKETAAPWDYMKTSMPSAWRKHALKLRLPGHQSVASILAADHWAGQIRQLRRPLPAAKYRAQIDYLDATV
jgi:hypothetical protein